jgi:DNA-binding response OmpR family regulator
MQPARELSQNGRKNILIIENDERVLNALEALVSAEGFNIRTTWSGREALALIQSQPFDLVLVADHLPDIYCGEFVKMASRHSRSIVVMHSGRPLPSSLRRYKTLGATVVVDKDDTRQLRQLLAARHIKSAPA